MALILAQHFPLGRFHATRWNQNPFEDPFGEWPPSPWRFLRALVARWIQYSRETGDTDVGTRNALLVALARPLPAFRLPEQSWRGRPELRQYQPTEVAWTDALAKAPAYKKPKTTLVTDPYRVLPADEPVYWLWEGTDLKREHLSLLHELLRRMHYFGRAESFCRFHILDAFPQGLQPNCILGASNGRGVPVLAPASDGALNLESLLAATDDRLLARHRIPPGAAWYYAELPRRPSPLPAEATPQRFPTDLTIIQFAVGGRVYPPLARWIKITEACRNRVLNYRCRQLTQGRIGRYADLSLAQQEELALLIGKTGRGSPLAGHRHVFFGLLPDEYGDPTRLLCWRQEPFSPDEVEAILAVSRDPYGWDSSAPDWRVRLVPLPFESLPPENVYGESSQWITATPLVLPADYIRFRQNGRERSGATVEKLVRKLVVKNGYPEPVNCVVPDGPHDARWVYVHENPEERRRRARERTPCVRPGFCVRLMFPQPVKGPICLGHSSHFGLGLFTRLEVSAPTL